jgi:hypothetical protein
MRSSDFGSSFQIPKFEAPAEILLSDNRRLRGRLFLSILSSSKLGHSSVLDSLNEPQKFFPFLLEESNQVEIINKDVVVSVTVDIKLDQDEGTDILNANLWIEEIELKCSPYMNLRGNVVLDLPPNKARVLDFFNLTTAFFALQDGEKHHIINKRYVTSIKELSALPPTNVPIVVVKAKRGGRKKKNT